MITRSDRLVLRTMKPGEEEILAGTGFRSFRSGERELWLRNVYQDNPYLKPADTLVVTIGGKIAGHASGYRLSTCRCAASRRSRSCPSSGAAAWPTRSCAGCTRR